AAWSRRRDQAASRPAPNGDRQRYGRDMDEATASDPAVDVTAARRLLLKVCAWRERAQLDKCWVDTGEAIRLLRTYELAEPPTITHGICTDCAQRITSARRVGSNVAAA
ncbi:MAG: hypothetical protein ACXVRA_11330, partial [Gaiellaceae bacterium]